MCSYSYTDCLYDFLWSLKYNSYLFFKGEEMVVNAFNSFVDLIIYFLDSSMSCEFFQMLYGFLFVAFAAVIIKKIFV